MRKSFPPLPSAPYQEPKTSRELERLMECVELSLKREKLDNAIQLAMEAARGEGVLIEHFIELGHRFGSSTVRKTQNARDRLRLIHGGKD